VRTRGGMPSPYNTNEFILAEHADETTRKLGQLYFYYFYLYGYGTKELIKISRKKFENMQNENMLVSNSRHRRSMYGWSQN
jgi:hypothetical protein